MGIGTCYWSWRKGKPCYEGGENLAELCSSVLWKLELTSSEIGYSAEDISKQSFEGVASFPSIADSKIWEESDNLREFLSKKEIELEDLKNSQFFPIGKNDKRRKLIWCEPQIRSVTAEDAKKRWYCTRRNTARTRKEKWIKTVGLLRFYRTGKQRHSTTNICCSSRKGKNDPAGDSEIISTATILVSKSGVTSVVATGWAATAHSLMGTQFSP